MTFSIPVELLVVGSFIILLIAWAIWYKLSNWILNKFYKPENDKSKYGEEKRRAELEGRKPNLERATIRAGNTEAFGGDELLPPQPSDSSGQDSKSPRGFFARRRKPRK